MSSKSLVALAALTAVALGLAVWISSDRGAGTTAGVVNAPLAPGLRASLNEVNEISVSTRGKQVTLVRSDSGWGVAERAGYPADTGAIREQLLALGDAKVLERKTSNPDYYADLGVADPETEGAGGILMSVSGAGDPVAIIVGDTNMNRSSTTFVRRPDDAQSLLVDGTFRLDADPTAWLRKDLVDVPASRVRRVAVTRGDEMVLEAVKADAEATQFLVTNLPEGRELTSAAAANSVAGALAGLRIDDVGTADEVGVPDEDVTTTVYETFDGLRVTARSWKTEDDHYMTLAAEYDESLSSPADINGESAEGNEAETNSESAAESPVDESETADVPAEAKAIGERATGWVYVIPSFKYTNMTKSVDDLLKPLPEESDGD